MNAQKALLRHLQKTFKVTSLHCTVVSDKIKECKKCFETLTNIEEQYLCCKKMDFTQSPYKDHSGLKHDLIYKLITALEEELQNLKLILANFSTANEKVQKQAEALFTLYHRYADQLSVDDLTEGDTMRPSICTMMEWTQEIQQAFFNQYCKRKYLIETIDYDKPETVTRLVEEWSSSKEISEISHDILPWVKFFLEEDLKT